MRRALRVLAVSALLLVPACGGWLWFGAGVASAYLYEDYYGDCFDDCDDDWDHHATWNPQALVAADFDGDGKPDLAVADRDEGVVWFRRGAAGRDEAPERRVALRDVAAQLAVFRPQGGLDPGLLALGGTGGLAEAFAGDGTGGFVPLAPAGGEGASPAARVALGRLDGDDADDLVRVDAAGAVRAALGRGDGTFADVAGDPAATFLGAFPAARLAGIHLAIAGFDDAAGNDLLVLDAERSLLATFPGLGDGRFGEGRSVSFSASGRVLAVAPVTVAPGEPVQVALLFEGAEGETSLAVVDPADGSRTIDDRTAFGARTLAPYDLDGDGRTDLLLAGGPDGAVHAVVLRTR